MFPRTLVLSIALALAACGAPGALPGDEPADDPPAVIEPMQRDAGSPLARDLAEPRPDLAECDHARPAPDLARPGAPDLARPAADLAEPPADLAQAPPAADLARGCGGMGQPCCSGSCSQGLLCLVEGELCGRQIPHACVVPLNCGGRGLPPCDDLGNPSAFGRCLDGLRLFSGKCAACL